MKKLKTLLVIALISSFNLNAQFNLTLETYAFNNFTSPFNPSYHFGAVDLQPKASTVLAKNEDGQDRILSFYSVTNEGVWLTIAGSNGNVLASKSIKINKLGGSFFTGTQQLIVNAVASHPEENIVVFTGRLFDASNDSHMFIATIDLSSFTIQSTMIDLPVYAGLNRAEGVQVKHLSNFEYIVVGKTIAGSTKCTSITKYNASTNTSSTKVIKDLNLIPNDFEFSNVNSSNIVIAGYTVRNELGFFEICGNVVGSNSSASTKINISFVDYDYNSNSVQAIKDYETEELYTNLSGGIPGVASSIYNNSLKIIKNNEYYIAISNSIDHSGSTGVGFHSILLQLDNGYNLVDSRSFNNTSNIKWDHEGRLAKVSNEHLAISMEYVGQGITNASQRGTIVTTSSFDEPFDPIDVLFRYDENPLNDWSTTPAIHYGGYNGSSLIANADHIYSSHATLSNNFANSNQNTVYTFSFEPSYKDDREVCEFEASVDYNNICIENVELEHSVQIQNSNPSAVTMLTSDVPYNPFYCNPENAESNNNNKSLSSGVSNSNADELGSTIEMELFPNPNSGLFTLNLSNSDSKTFTLVVENMLGQTVYSELINVDGSIKKQMDLEKFGKGIYTISLKSESENFVKKVIVK
ncbi:MAG: T9SS type A sorting domain-containing protein [Crocinitomicaceae bacterium]